MRRRAPLPNRFQKIRPGKSPAGNIVGNPATGGDTSKGRPARHPIVRATLWMTGTLISFMAMAIGGRELSAELNTFQILFFRSLIGLVAIGALMRPTGWRRLQTGCFLLHAARNIAHFGGQFGWFYGLATLSLAEVFAIEFTVPVWTAVLATLLLGERLTRPRITAIALGIAGMLIILRPGAAVFQPAALAVLGGAVGYALSHTLTRKLAQIDPPLVIIFYMTAIQLPLGLVPSLAGWVSPSPAMWPWLLAVGLSALTAHYCMARALKLADATVVVPMDFMRLPLIALVGLTLYGERPDVLVLVGAVVMLAGNLVNVRAEHNKPGA
jgi:drug/metabolite transporter (DMT)-like permease